MNPLLSRHPPENTKPTEPEEGLWWAVVRLGARDLRYGTVQEGLDAIEFLRSTGLWLLTDMFGLEPRQAMAAITRLLAERNASGRHPIDMGGGGIL